MSEGFVADSSLGVAWATPSQANAATENLLNQVLAGMPIVVPVLWALEVSNGLLMLLKRKLTSVSEWQEAGQRISRIGAILDQDAPQLALSKISELARKFDMTVYDATYLELALRRGLPLASRDTALNKAAKRSGVKTLL